MEKDNRIYASVISRRRRTVLRRVSNIQIDTNHYTPPYSRCCCGGHSPCASCNHFAACRAVPDSNSRPLHGVLTIGYQIRPLPVLFATHLATESAGVSCVLGYLHLFDLLTQGGTVTLEEPRLTIVSISTSPPLTVPYLPVMPTFFVRFVCEYFSELLDGERRRRCSPS